MKKPHTPTQTSPIPPSTALRCPACGAAIPVAEAVEQAVAARTQSAQADLARLEARLRSEAQGQLRDLEDRLCAEHAHNLAKVEKEQSQTIAEFKKTLAESRAALKREQADMHEVVASAITEAQVKVQESRKAAKAQMESLQAHLKLAEGNQSKAEVALAQMEARLAAAQNERTAAFEKGRTQALEQSRKQMSEFQALLDELRAEALKREREQAKGLALAVRDAEVRGAALEAQKQETALRSALEGERQRMMADVSKEHAVERQRLETQIQRLRQEIDTLHRKAESGPSEATGDAAESLLEQELREAFLPEGDTLVRARKGQKAADLTLTVARAGGRTLLVESKWTQTWDPTWVAKAKLDGKAAGAEAVVIASRALPSGVAHLTQVDDVWVASPEAAPALVGALRQGLIAVERAKRAANMDETRVQSLKAYLGGPQFRQQVEQIVGLAADLGKGLLRERTQHERAWKEAQAAFEHILTAAIGIWTDLELASGQGLQASKVLAPFLQAGEDEPKPKRRPRAA